MYLDFGLAIPKLSVQGMISAVKELLDLAPTKKVLQHMKFKLVFFIYFHLDAMFCLGSLTNVVPHQRGGGKPSTRRRGNGDLTNNYYLLTSNLARESASSLAV